MTDLPFGRGGSPLQNLIVRGYDTTKLTALQCVDELDAGPVYLKRDLSLLGTADEIMLRASSLMTDMISNILALGPQPKAQEGDVIRFKRRTREDGNMLSLQSLGEVFDYIRMLDGEGYPPAFVEVGLFRLEFTRASLKMGEVLSDVKITRRRDVD
jgi:methionyl-tRNA formyltransferase